jgi:hypothetical protein
LPPGREARVSSQATSKAATEETRDRAERGSAVRGSDRATVVAEEDTRADRPRNNLKCATAKRANSESRVVSGAKNSVEQRE